MAATGDRKTMERDQTTGEAHGERFEWISFLLDTGTIKKNPRVHTSRSTRKAQLEVTVLRARTHTPGLGPKDIITTGTFSLKTPQLKHSHYLMHKRGVSS